MCRSNSFFFLIAVDVSSVDGDFVVGCWRLSFDTFGRDVLYYICLRAKEYNDEVDLAVCR